MGGRGLFRLISWGLAAALAGCSGRTAPEDRADLACPVGAPPAIQADFTSGAATRDDTLSVAALSREGDVGFGHLALGLTEARLTSDVSYRVSHAPALTEGSCVYVAFLQVRLSYAARIVHIAREFDTEPCLHREILAHEERHVALDDALMPQLVAGLPRDLVAELNGRAQWGATPAEADAQLQASLAAAIKGAINALSDRRRAAHEERVDTPQERRRIDAACGGRVRQLHLTS